VPLPVRGGEIKNLILLGAGSVEIERPFRCVCCWYSSAQCGCEFHKEFIAKETTNWEATCLVLRTCSRRDSHLTAVLCSNDMVAIGALRTFHRRGFVS